jgi:hypothetical protein
MNCSLEEDDVPIDFRIKWPAFKHWSLAVDDPKFILGLLALKADAHIDLVCQNVFRATLYAISEMITRETCLFYKHLLSNIHLMTTIIIVYTPYVSDANILLYRKR